MEEIINRVSKSGIQTIDLAEYYPKDELAVIDIKDWLFHGLILREQDFRQKLDEHDWQQYGGKYVSLTCSADAIIPLWAYMLITMKVQPFAATVIYGKPEELLSYYFRERLKDLNPKEFEGQRVVVKGCGDKEIPASAYVEITRLLMPFARSIMYGEPCSTVPIFKKGK